MHYEDASDFFEMFEADTFDKELLKDGVFTGYVDIDGKLVPAAGFTFNGDGGTGWYDDTLI